MEKWASWYTLHIFILHGLVLWCSGANIIFKCQFLFKKITPLRLKALQWVTWKSRLIDIGQQRKNCGCNIKKKHIKLEFVNKRHIAFLQEPLCHIQSLVSDVIYHNSSTNQANTKFFNDSIKSLLKEQKLVQTSLFIECRLFEAQYKLC